MVDKIESNRLFLQETLAKTNLEVVSTNNGHEGILLCIELQPKLIFMDIQMPVLNGFEAAGILKTRPDTSRIPIIALTASPTKQEKEKALASGFSGYLPKPLDLGALLSEICRYVAYQSNDKKTPGEQKRSRNLLSWQRQISRIFCAGS